MYLYVSIVSCVKFLFCHCIPVPCLHVFVGILLFCEHFKAELGSIHLCIPHGKFSTRHKVWRCSINVNWMSEWINDEQISRCYLRSHFVSYTPKETGIQLERMLALFICHIRNSMIHWKEKGPYTQRDLRIYFGFVIMPTSLPWVNYWSLKALNSLIRQIRIHTSQDSYKE